MNNATNGPLVNGLEVVITARGSCKNKIGILMSQSSGTKRTGIAKSKKADPWFVSIEGSRETLFGAHQFKVLETKTTQQARRERKRRLQHGKQGAESKEEDTSEIQVNNMLVVTAKCQASAVKNGHKKKLNVDDIGVVTGILGAKGHFVMFAGRKDKLLVDQTAMKAIKVLPFNQGESVAWRDNDRAGEPRMFHVMGSTRPGFVKYKVFSGPQGRPDEGHMPLALFEQGIHNARLGAGKRKEQQNLEAILNSQAPMLGLATRGMLNSSKVPPHVAEEFRTLCDSDQWAGKFRDVQDPREIAMIRKGSGDDIVKVAIKRLESSALVQFLLDNGYDANQNGLLFVAIKADNYEVVKLLVKGRSPYLSDGWQNTTVQNWTPLECCDVFNDNERHHQIRKMLVRAGCRTGAGRPARPDTGSSSRRSSTSSRRSSGSSRRNSSSSATPPTSGDEGTGSSWMPSMPKALQGFTTGLSSMLSRSPAADGPTIDAILVKEPSGTTITIQGVLATLLVKDLKVMIQGKMMQKGLVADQMWLTWNSKPLKDDRRLVDYGMHLQRNLTVEALLQLRGGASVGSSVCPLVGSLGTKHNGKVAATWVTGKAGVDTGTFQGEGFAFSIDGQQWNSQQKDFVIRRLNLNQDKNNRRVKEEFNAGDNEYCIRCTDKRKKPTDNLFSNCYTMDGEDALGLANIWCYFKRPGSVSIMVDARCQDCKMESKEVTFYSTEGKCQQVNYSLCCTPIDENTGRTRLPGIKVSALYVAYKKS